MSKTMKFTSKDLMKAMGLQVGDKVKYRGEIYTVRENDDLIHSIYLYIYKDGGHIYLELFDMFDGNYELLPKPKRIGDLKCSNEVECTKCPFKMVVNCICLEGKTLNEVLNVVEEVAKENNIFDQEIYDLLKARLDKEVKEEEKAKELFKWRVRIGEYGEGIADGWVYANSITEAENKVKKHYTNCYHNVEIYEDYDPSNDKDVMCGLEDYKKYGNDVFVRWED